MAGAKADHVSIGDVLASLRDDFPDVTVSKIRFLESQGLIDPERTPSGYRKFSALDVERLRFILREQQDHFLPLRVIKERLDEIDANGGFVAGQPPRPIGGAVDANEVLIDDADQGASSTANSADPVGVLFQRTRREAAVLDAQKAADSIVAGDGDDEDILGDLSGASLTRAELAKASELTEAEIAELEEYGILAASPTSRDQALFDEEAFAIARAAAGFMRRGIEPRHLRMYRQFVEREASLFGQVLLGLRHQRGAEAEARSDAELRELATSGRRLRAIMLRQAMRETGSPRR